MYQTTSPVIFFAKVEREYLLSWEYYKNDIDLLGKCYSSVIICSGYWSFILTLLKNKKADVFCWWWHTSLPVILISRLFGRFVFCTGAIHMFDCSGASDFYTKSCLYRWAIKLSLRLCSLNIFISNDQSLSISSHLRVGRSLVLPSGLGCLSGKRPNPVKKFQITHHASSIKFLYFSWLTLDQIKRKGLFPLLDAFSVFVRCHDVNAKLVIGGKSGDAIATIHAKVDDLSLSNNIEYCLDISLEDKNALFESVDLLITPSYMEGFGNASLEAMSHGCPVLVSRFGASHEVVGDVGFVINEINANSILEKLVLYKSYDFQERCNLRELSYIRANEKFSFDGRVKIFCSAKSII